MAHKTAAIIASWCLKGLLNGAHFYNKAWIFEMTKRAQRDKAWVKKIAIFLVGGVFVFCFILLRSGEIDAITEVKFNEKAGNQLRELADRVVVLKEKRKLIVMRADKVLRIFNIALGRYAKGHKFQEGDARTPEGSYILDKKLRDSQFYRAIRISYPNETDIARARASGVNPGGKIMIHGLPNQKSEEDVGHPYIDWTQGCIAVTNREMRALWSIIEPGIPIEIHP